ncbi:hypothetical protein [Vulcanisaeta souniana]|uniref:Uncharacterized protein n=1 Tax=Vulcanisaeta souniana JCM 11219 TaxID=1293586 RepID=A0A830E2P6_9CREN|nr:hypothetical protein [Vulcanisaeta souniana]BDR91112.1 hypothetical protein Vsou_02050 [Vulcanisaeta souniana JCM 11219]GGI80903.1 hypothetical protein GCM10007112_17130 [Vulcanisaeta souniana JCM 11219]
MESEPITLIINARRNLQIITNLMNSYEKTKDINTLNNIMKLGLSTFDDVVRAFLMAREIRVRNWEHAVQVARDFIPSGIINDDLRDFFIKCTSQYTCDPSLIGSRINELSRFIDFVGALSTHRVPYRGL